VRMSVTVRVGVPMWPVAVIVIVVVTAGEHMAVIDRYTQMVVLMHRRRVARRDNSQRHRAWIGRCL
jgi:hypothetical protein